MWRYSCIKISLKSQKVDLSEISSPWSVHGIKLYFNFKFTQPFLTKFTHYSLIFRKSMQLLFDTCQHIFRFHLWFPANCFWSICSTSCISTQKWQARIFLVFLLSEGRWNWIARFSQCYHCFPYAFADVIELVFSILTKVEACSPMSK